MKKIYSGLGQIAGVITILVFAFIQLDALVEFGFVTDQVEDIIRIVQTYAVYLLAGLAGLELFAGKKILAIIFFLILAFVVVSSFFSEVMDQIINII